MVMAHVKSNTAIIIVNIVYLLMRMQINNIGIENIIKPTNAHSSIARTCLMNTIHSIISINASIKAIIIYLVARYVHRSLLSISA